MAQEALRLPARFPVGTRYVIERRAGLISLRYLEFPDGRKVDLPSDLAPRAAANARRRRLGRPSPAKKNARNAQKILNRAGTKPGMPGC
jgi:hypothetical protein